MLSRRKFVRGALAAAGGAAAASLSLQDRADAAASLGPVYVSPDGDDLAAGTEDRPKRTIQAALDAFGTTTSLRVGRIVARGTFDVADTIRVTRRAVIIEGDGASPGTGERGLHVRWTGQAGRPVFEYSQAWGGGIRAAHITKAPGAGTFSAGVCLIAATTDANPNAHMRFEDLWIGPMGGYDPESTPADVHGTRGIAIEGADRNNDMSVWDKVYISNCVKAVEIVNIQHVGHSFRDLFVNFAETAFETRARTQGENWYFLNTRGCDLVVHGGAWLNVDGFRSERSARLARIGNGDTGGRLSIQGGHYQLNGTTMAADRVIVDGYHNRTASMTLRDFEFTQFLWDPLLQSPILRLKAQPGAAAHKAFVGEGIQNFELTWLDMGLSGAKSAGDTRYTRVVRLGAGVASRHLPLVYEQLLTGA